MAKSGQSSKLLEYICLTINVIHLSGVLDIVKVLIKSAFWESAALSRKFVHFPPCLVGPLLHSPLSPHLPSPPTGKVPRIPAKMVHFLPQNAYDFKRRYAGFPARIGVNADIKQMFITASDIMSRSIFDAVTLQNVA